MIPLVVDGDHPGRRISLPAGPGAIMLRCSMIAFRSAASGTSRYLRRWFKPAA